MNDADNGIVITNGDLVEIFKTGYYRLTLIYGDLRDIYNAERYSISIYCDRVLSLSNRRVLMLYRNIDNGIAMHFWAQKGEYLKVECPLAFKLELN